MQISLTKLWNNSLVLADRELKVRDYSWASELGKSMVDRYLAMNAVKPTNPPNERSRRKFFAGNVWEFIAGLIIHQLGIVITKQEVIECNDMPLKVRGKLDYLIGGVPDYGKARDFVNSLPFEADMLTRFMRVIDNFEAEYGDKEIDLTVHEIKSCSEYVIDKIQAGGAIPGHDLQTGHYLRGLNMNNGIIDYISKNDALMAERVVTITPAINKALHDDLAELKGYLDAKQQPGPAPLIVFESKFQKNFNVEYSAYLELVYNFKTPEDYRNSVQSKIASWNRLLKRLQMINEGKTTPTGKVILLTESNKKAIDEMEKEGWKAHDLVKVATIAEDDEPELF